MPLIGGTCEPYSVVANWPGQWTAILNASADRDCPPEDLHISKTVKAYGIVVDSVTFGTMSNTSMKSVLRDDTGAAYPTPHWKDNSGDNDNDDVGDHNFPVVYPAGTRMDLSATLSVFPPLPLTDTFTVTATGSRVGLTYTFSAPATNTGSTLTISNVPADNLLPAHVDYMNPLWLSWSVTQTNGEKPMSCSIPGTGHRIYVTLGTPNPTSLYETVIDVGCRNAINLTDTNLAIDAIWSEFTDREVRRKLKDGYNNNDNTQLTYYQNWNCQNLDTKSLLAGGDGQCGSWASFFLDMLYSQGITLNCPYIVFYSRNPIDTTLGFTVKNWTFNTSGNSGDAEYPYFNTTQKSPPHIGPVHTYSWTHSEVNDLAGVEGQGTVNPASLFWNHQVVKIGTQYYDPSYGAIYNSLADIDSIAIDGYYKRRTVFWNEDDVGIDLNSDGDMIDQQEPTFLYLLQINPVGNQLVEGRREYPNIMIVCP